MSVYLAACENRADRSRRYEGDFSQPGEGLTMRTASSRLCLLTLVSLCLLFHVAVGQLPTDGLDAYYPFNSDVLDQSGNHHNGLAVGASLVPDRFGKSKSAYWFNGTTDYIRLGDILDSVFCAPVAKFTITGWAKTDAFPRYQGGGDIIAKTAGGSKGPYQWSLNQDPDGTVGWNVCSRSDAGAYVEKRSLPIPIGRWLFYALVFDGSLPEVDRVQLYVDGVPGQLSRHVGTLGTTTEATAQEITIGAGHLGGNPGAPDNQYNGTVDDVRIYHRVLSSTEMFSLFHEGGWPIPVPPAASIICVPPPVVLNGSEFDLDIKIGDTTRTANVFGASFDLTFSNPSFISFVSADVSGSYLGGDLLYLVTPDNVNGKVGVGISRKAPMTGMTGGGTLLRLKFRIAVEAPDRGTVNFAFSNFSAMDQNGLSIVLTPVPALLAIQGMSVWPGDTDNSGLANQNDILPLGLYMGFAGPARVNASLQWSPQPAKPWAVRLATYADANGDGVVNQADILPIGLNWNRLHSTGAITMSTPMAEFYPQLKFLGNPVLRALGPATVRGTSAFDVNIVLGDSLNPVADLFGIAFVLDFSDSKSILQATEAAAGSLLGSDILFLPQLNNTGTVALGMTRKNGAGAVTGYGQLAKIRFQVVGSTAASTLTLAVRDIVAIDADGTPISVQSSSSSLAVSVKEVNAVPAGFELRQNFPNPFNPSTRIAYSVPMTSLVRLSVLDLLGREVDVLFNGERTPGIYESRWDAGSHPSGMYICRLQAGNVIQLRKMVLIE
jgi:hypothetical protein